MRNLSMRLCVYICCKYGRQKICAECRFCSFVVVGCVSLARRRCPSCRREQAIRPEWCVCVVCAFVLKKCAFVWCACVWECVFVQKFTFAHKHSLGRPGRCCSFLYFERALCRRRRRRRRCRLFLSGCRHSLPVLLECRERARELLQLISVLEILFSPLPQEELSSTTHGNVQRTSLALARCRLSLLVAVAALPLWRGVVVVLSCAPPTNSVHGWLPFASLLLCQNKLPSKPKATQR